MKDITSEVKSAGCFFKEKVCRGIENIRSEIDADVRTVLLRDPAPHKYIEVLLTHQGVHAILSYRAAHFLQEHGHGVSARVISQLSRAFTGIEIHPSAVIGRELLIDHGSGVVIGETAVVGDGCTLHQGVTLGATGKENGKRHPTLENGVYVGAGAMILGSIVIGNGAKIGANAVVLNSVEEGRTAVGVPAKIIN